MAPRRKRNTAQGATHSVTVVCDGCRSTLGTTECRAHLIPCNHLVCMLCLSTCLAKRVPSDYAECPCSGCEEETFHSHTPTVFPRESTVPREMETVPQSDPIRDVISNPSEAKDPVRFYYKQRDLQRQDNEEGLLDNSNIGILFLAQSVYSEEHNKRVFVSHTAHLDYDMEAFASVDDQQRAACIFQGLAKVLLPKQSNTEKTLALLPNLLISHAISDKDPLVSLLYSLTHGKALTDCVRRGLESDPSKSYARSDYLACWVAKEMLISARNYNKSTTLQVSIGDALDSLGVSFAVKDIMSRFRLSCSRSQLKRVEIKALHQRIHDPEFTVGPKDFIVYCFDNLAFDKKGREATAQQWTVLSVAIIHEDVLRRLGFYEVDPEKRISRERRTLNQLTETCNTDKEATTAIVGVRQEDVDELSFYLLCVIEYVIGLKLPSVERCQEYMVSNDASVLGGCTIQCNLGIDVHPRHSHDNQGNPITLRSRRYAGVANDHVVEVEEPGNSTLFTKNRLFVDLPLKEDLASKATVKGYVHNVFLKVNQEQLSEWDSDNDEDEEPPLADLMVPIAADNSPIYQLNILKDEDLKSNTKRYIKVQPFAGGFHQVKEVISKMGTLMEAFRIPFIEQYRAGEKKQKFNLDPNDPNQFEEEAVEFICAHVASAVDDLMESKANTSDNQRASAKEVHDMITRRCRKYATAMGVRIDIGLHMVYLILRDAEKANDDDKYFRGVRLALPLLSATHATHYVRTCCDLLVWRATASDAELVLFKAFAFTRSTTTGKHMYIDRCQEKINLFFRERIGRVVRVGHDAKMLALSMNINDAAEVKQAVREMDGKSPVRESIPFNEKLRDVGKVFASVRVKSFDMRLWKEHEPLLVGETEDTMEPVEENILRSPNDKPIRTHLLRFWSMGCKRLLDYFKKYYLSPDGRNSSSRSEKLPEGVPMPRIQSKASDFVSNCTSRELSTSLDIQSVVKASGTRKNPIVLEIQRLNSRLPLEARTVITPAVVKDTSVLQFATTLVDMRIAYFGQCQSEGRAMTEVTEELARTSFAGDALSDPHIRDQELEQPFFRLSRAVQADFVTKVQYNMLD